MVDKMYIMLPEFDIVGYDYKKAKKDFKGEQKIMDTLSELFEEGDFLYDLANTPIEFREWFENNKEKYKIEPQIKKIKYNMDKLPQDNSLKARNNMLIDLIWGVLTNPDTASKILNPGGFDNLKKASRINLILKSSTIESLKKALEEGGVKFDKRVDKNGLSQPAEIVSYLFDLPLSINSSTKKKLKQEGKAFISLEDLVSSVRKPLNPLSPRTQIYFHQQNMTGAKLIGIYATHNASHALMQHTSLELNKHGAFFLNGKKLTSLHGITNFENQFISKNNAEFVAASVDNAKDPVLADINQNEFTADASMLLSRLGFKPLEIGLLMAQPIIEDITKSYFRNKREGKGKDVIIKEIFEKYRKKAAMMHEITYDNYKNELFLIEDLANNILIGNKISNVVDANSTSNYDEMEFYNRQLAVGHLFIRILKNGEALSMVTQATRSDTDKGGAGPTIADTMIKIQKVQDLLDAIETDPKFPLDNAGVIRDNIIVNKDTKIDKLREELLKSELPFLQAFYTLGVRQSEWLLHEYFPHYNKDFNRVIDTLRRMTKTEKLDVKTMNSIYNDLFAFIVSKGSFFGNESKGSEEDASYTTNEDKRKYFINNFPAYFRDVVSKNEDIASLEFIKRLKTVRPNDKNPVETIQFKNVGRLSATLRERYSRDWTSLLYSSNPEAQKLALNLFRYCYYRNGFAFGPSTFIHLASMAVRYAVPEYIEIMRSLLKHTDSYANFIDQYIYNHLDNRKLVPEIPDSSSVSFTDDKKDTKDTVSFTIDKNSNPSDMKAVRKQTDTPDGPVYEFFEYIARRHKGGFVYYRRDYSVPLTKNTAVYSRIEPLGYVNSFIEYDYHSTVEEMTSVIGKNKKDYKPDLGGKGKITFLEEEEGIPEYHEDENPQSYEDVPQYTEADEGYREIPNTYESNESAMNGAFYYLYGEQAEMPSYDEGYRESFKFLESYEPNTEYKDSNDEAICG